MFSTSRSLDTDQSSAEDRRSTAGAGLNLPPADDSPWLADLAVRVALAARSQPANGEPAERSALGITVGALQVTFGGQHGSCFETAGSVVREAWSDAAVGLRDLPTVDLRAAAAAVWGAIANGASAVCIEGGPAAGTTTLFKVLAAGAREHGFADGALLGTDVRGPAADVAQLLAAALDPGQPPRYRTAAELTAVAGGRRSLVLLRRAKLTASDMTELGLAFPGFCFVVDNALALPATPTVLLGPLDAGDALTLLEASSGRWLGPDDRGLALNLCASVGSLPESIRLVGIAARELRCSFASLAQQFGFGDEIVRALIASRPPLEVRILGLLALARAPLASHHIAYVLRNGAIDTSLRNLAARELIRTCEGQTYEVSRYVEGLVPLPDDADNVRARIVAALRDVFESWPAEPVRARQVAAAETFLEEMSQHSEWLQVLALGPQLAQTFAIRGAFGAWGRALREVEAAAARAGDARMHAFARHELGIRAVLLGNHAEAQAYLRAAVADRKAEGDEAGAAASYAALMLVDPGVPDHAPAAPPEASKTPAAPSVGRLDRPRMNLPGIHGFRLPRIRAPRLPMFRFQVRRSDLHCFRLPGRLLTVALIGLGLALAGLIVLAVAGRPRPSGLPAIVGFWARPASIPPGGTANVCFDAQDEAVVEIFPNAGRLPGSGTHCVAVRPPVSTTYVAVGTALDGRQARRELTVMVGGTERARIAAFSARPARIRAGGSIQLCYAVTGAHRLLMVPRIGTLMRLRDCRTIALKLPRRYDYRLTALGDDGSVAVRHAHVDVIARAGKPGTVAPALGKSALRAIRKFSASSRSIQRGQTATICVAVDHSAAASLLPIGTLRTGTTRCYHVRPRATTVYRLRVAAGHSVAVQTLTIKVRAPRKRHDVAPRKRH